ncbi:Ig-like domain-containing protein [Clostridium sp. A1-XYC3]|uniref:Ig-like domain-containing protein n=1 Tax=Clostridium tanneri TaxID=3037988 RepID=A0ABU4JWP7_9CLOT|nr:Ig-like domain-containing protein [Clostridium sp. A1-XYC3]MDW8802579.1 Ig-like domain-containing protein [Clostridium sp. A1-XYC3]
MKLKTIFTASIICVSLFSAKAAAADVNLINNNTYSAITTANSEVKLLESKSNIPSNKKWTIKFNKEVDYSSLSQDSVQVIDNKGQAVSVKLTAGSDNTSIDVLPPSSNYSAGQTYTIIIKKSLNSKTNKTLSKEVRMSFTIASSSSSGGTGSSGGSSGSGNTSEADPVLVEASSGLEKVKGIVKTQAEKDLVSELKSSVDAKINDPSITINTAALKAKYKSLSNAEKEDFQSAILSNFSIGTLLKIKSMFD